MESRIMMKNSNIIDHYITSDRKQLKSNFSVKVQSNTSLKFEKKRCFNERKKEC